ncbi:MAG: hypothetical protein OIF32_11190, partial [Campylobacterales bacterium]|nr:hypothetical protein [Campylobacterales bacterium]
DEKKIETVELIKQVKEIDKIVYKDKIVEKKVYINKIDSNITRDRKEFSDFSSSLPKEALEKNGDMFEIFSTFDSLGKFKITLLSKDKLVISKFKSILFDTSISFEDYKSRANLYIPVDILEKDLEVYLKVLNMETEETTQDRVYFISELEKDHYYKGNIYINSGVDIYIDEKKKIPSIFKKPNSKNLQLPAIEQKVNN